MIRLLLARRERPRDRIGAESTTMEPRWPAFAALAAVGALYMALPESLAVGPRWLLFALVFALLVPKMLTHRHGYWVLNVIIGHATAAIVTAFSVWSLALLVMAMPSHNETPGDLLRSAAALWVSNVLIFAIWYWRLDAGGPHMRDLRETHTTGAFLFPQMVMEQNMLAEAGLENWSPQFVDYLFLAFTASTAFSPTDTAVLSRWAKVLMMVQAGISLAIIALLAARAVNIL